MKIYKIPTELKTIIFDIDSTLYTHKIYAQDQLDVLIRRYGQEVGISEDEAQKKVAHFRSEFAKKNNGKKVSLGNTLLSFGISIETTIEWRKELMVPENFLKLDSKLQESLKLLMKNYKLICVTNNPTISGARTLKAIGVTDFIQEVIGLDVCKVSKPAKEPFLLAAEKTGAKPEECLSVGDRFDIDLDFPLQLGMGAILVDGVEDVYKFPEILR